MHLAPHLLLHGRIPVVRDVYNSDQEVQQVKR